MNDLKLSLLFVLGLLILCGTIKAEENSFSVARTVKLGRDFKPRYNGRVISRDQLNLTRESKLVTPEPDYYAPGEGPEDDDLEDEDYVSSEVLNVPPSSSESSVISSSSTTTTTTTTTPKSNVFSVAESIKPSADFKPKYKGVIISRNKLNLTDMSLRVNPEPDYYEPGEGPEDDDEEEEVKMESKEEFREPEISASTAMPSSSTTSKTTPMSNVLSVASMIKPGSDFKPKYQGKIITREKLNLTELSRRVNPEPDYYEPGEGPESDDDELEESTEESKKDTMNEVKPSPESTSNKPKLSSNSFSIAEMFKPGEDFKPLYKGKVITRNQLNLTDMSKLVNPEPDYYEPGEGPEDFDESEESDLEALGIKPTQSSGTTSTSTTTETSREVHYSSNDDEPPQEDIDLAVGGISGVFEKIIKGPKASEINENSKPEDIYVYLSEIIRDESGKAFKATLPRIYDYQFPIGNLVSQRCFNSFAQFGDRLRKGYVWPLKMVAASAGLSLNKFALRGYGDFDSCLKIVADDPQRRYDEVFFTGQYCMAQVNLPLPELNRNLTYQDRVLHFNSTEVEGTFTEYMLQNAPFMYSNPLSMALCVPSTCLPSEIEDVIHFFLKKFQIKFQMGVDCYSRLNMTVTALPGELTEMTMSDIVEQSHSKSWLQVYRELSVAQTWAIAYLLLSVLLVSLCTLYELRKLAQNDNQWSSSERDRPKSVLACFSVRYNLEQMGRVRHRYMYELPQPKVTSLNQVQGEADLEAITKNVHQCHHLTNTSTLDALKTIGLVWICLANFYLLGYQPQLLSSLTHLRELVLGLKQNILFQLVAQSWLSMEIFFLISGFLLAYTSLPYIVRYDGRPKLTFFFIKRIIRFIPSLAFVMLILSLLPLWRNAGPIYNSSVAKLLKPCRRFYWRNLFFISNLYEYDEVCLPYIWYLSNNFQLSMIGVFVTVFAYNRPKHALKAFLALVLGGFVAPGYTAYVKRLSMSSPILEKAVLEEIPALVKDLFFNIPAHFSAYFFGLGLGYYSRMNRIDSFRLVKPLRILLWIALPLLSVLAIYLPMLCPFEQSSKYARTFTVLYYALYRLVFVASFAWLVHQTLHVRTGLIKLFSSPVFRTCSHLALPIYLLNLVVIWIYFFTKRTLIETTLVESFPVAFTLLVITVVLALLCHLLFEAPYRSIFQYYFESPRTLSPMVTVNQFMDGKPMSNGGYRKELLNPNFLFSPHYNMVTNVSSRCESEASSLANFPIGPTIEPNGNGCLPKSFSSVSMAPSLSDDSDFNNNHKNVPPGITALDPPLSNQTPPCVIINPAN